MKNTISKIIPSNFTNLFGLAKKLLFSKNPAGRAAMLYSLLGILMIPLDWIFQFFEKRLYRKANEPEYPLILVCGPPRSGTTLVAQVLIKHLPVYYFNNLTSIFPNSPIVANKIFGRFLKKGNKDVYFKSLYGRTPELWAPNDALYLWDRWTEVHRNTIPKTISPKNKLKMQQFFGAVENYSGLPLVNKNNRLNTFANLVAETMDTAYFICLDRDPVYLAQSELIASRFIHGNEKVPYGVRFDEKNEPTKDQHVDPIQQVCDQVLRHKKMMREQERLIGKERFIIVPYEEFCAKPAEWVSEISNRILGQKLGTEELEKILPAFKRSNTRKIENKELNEIKKKFNLS
ncbi:sulfotransferase [Pareuzebyella sediminis]|uniref:sulfotransferase n=1 Tax=Pareuzebyella sediminis TaxID=2607998 RepID=UPI0011ED896B|nr:sulfotransferase [Pareuzebyella sediminis]